MRQYYNRFVLEFLQRTVHWPVFFHYCQEHCVVLRSEMYEKGETLHKLLQVDPAHVEQENELWVAKQVTMDDKRKGTRSVLSIQSIEIDPEIPDRVFTESELSRRR
jgi:hypothetical protein